MVKRSLQKKYIGEVSILSWNINDSRSSTQGAKVDDPAFANILSAHDIFCLQETKAAIAIPDYICINSNRSDSRSGGVCIGYKKSIAKAVSEYKVNSSEDIVGVSLKAHHFNLDEDIVLFNVYNSPENSSYSSRKRNGGDCESLSTMEALEASIMGITSNKKIFLAGDFNARVGNLVDVHIQSCHPGCDDSIWDEDYPADLPSRSNKDSTTNAAGKSLIDLLRAANMVILNGRTVGDIFGEYTCYKWNGCSAIDLMCTSSSLYDNIKSVCVLELNMFSDHRPVSTVISARNRIERVILNSKDFKDAPKPYKWKQGPTSDRESSAYSYLKQQLTPSTLASTDELSNRAISSEEDIKSFNNDVIKLLTDAAGPKPSFDKKERTNHKKWFDWECRRSKRTLRKLAKRYSKNPFDVDTRNDFWSAKKTHRNLIKNKKDAFFKLLNEKVRNKNSIDWDTFKKLKEETRDNDPFDIYDLQNFYQFFKDLYNRRCSSSLDAHSNDSYSARASDNDIPDQLVELSLDSLNVDITIDDLDSCIANLRNNKSVSEDLVSNEMLKNMSTRTKALILKLFNGCLKEGVYPWNTALTSPLHKKGNRHNPDNYRAITVGSCLGKLFSSILLQRLVIFRKTRCPDYPNQLGFCKGGQCSDHILTLKTMIDKYVTKQRGRLFACFVDFRKAFDLVCRDALLYKLSQLGLQGRVFNCIKYMYQHSSTRIKLVKKISDAIEVTIGTEQGHPMSPELFKMFVYDLSTELEASDILDCPELNGYKISHLLWADDLILIAKDGPSLQKLIDILNSFVTHWELQVNISKTNVMVFNTSSRLLKCSVGFSLGGEAIEPTKFYTYLGIVISLNGSMNPAIQQLGKKAIRAFFSMKKVVDIRALPTSSTLKLFDCLIKPVALYGSQVWFPATHICRAILRGSSLYEASSKDKIELSHLKMLKWLLGVHKKTSNIFCYGDTGRIPISLSAIPQGLRYYRRVRNFDTAQCRDTPLIAHAFAEQKALKLEWYTAWQTISNLQAAHTDSSSDQTDHLEKATVTVITEKFISGWNEARSNQSKMHFYNGIKPNFGEERYLSSNNRTARSAIARIRSSAHDLNLERGRYKPPKDGIRHLHKLCRYCCADKADSIDTLIALENLPFYEPILETEVHAISECPAYHHLRSGLSDTLKTLIVRGDYLEIMTDGLVDEEFGIYLHKCYKLRHPKKEKKQ